MSTEPDRRPAAPGASSPTTRGARVHAVHLGGRCGLRCAPCDCRAPASSDLDRLVGAGAERLVLRGHPGSDAALAALVRRARQAGTAQIVLRTHALDRMTPEAARALAATGIDAVLVPLFSSAPPVHDRIAGRPDALAHALVALRALATAGLAIEVEAPILSPKLQRLAALVELAHRAVPTLRAVRFVSSAERVPDVLTPPSWAVAGPALAEGIRAARARGVSVELGPSEGVPLCALRDAPDVEDALRFDPRRPVRLPPDRVRPAGCGACAARAQCAGVTGAYADAHGDAGLVPFGKKPRAMYAQRTPGSPVFTAAHRKLGAGAGMLVLRPTVNCNQDCTFCSANETSNNVWTEPREMLRALVRAAQRGVRRVSFGGGEPTLARDLVHYVDAARRLGIPTIELVTNAVLLDRPAKVAALRAAGVTDAFVSLHAHDERLSQALTRKAGDFERTLAGVRNLLDAGVSVVLNHVVMSRNAPYLARFVERVHAEFGGRAAISFAFVTPQFKVLEDLSQMPRLSDVMPHLRRALHRALALGQPVKVGSRQGIPPCFLREFQAFSDILGYGAEPLAEDAPQKQRAPGCATCRYAAQCTGLWRPYVARYGLDELESLPGGPFRADELAALAGWEAGRIDAPPRSFDDLPALLRDRDAEAESLAWLAAHDDAPPPLRALPVLGPRGTRPLRTLFAGSGRQARRLAEALAEVPGLSLDGVASPHAPDAPSPEFGGCPRYRSLDEALVDMRPDAVVIAASTHAHHALALAALRAGVPVLLEKPLARTDAEALAIVEAVASTPGARLLSAHNLRFSSGLDAVLEAAGRPAIGLVRRVPEGAPDAPRVWSRSALFEVLHHALSVTGPAAGGGVPVVRDVSFTGDAAPRRITARLTYPRATAALTFDFDAGADELLVTRAASDDAAPARVWRRRGRETTLEIDGAAHPVPREGRDVVRMLAHFRDVARGDAQPLVTAVDALDVMRGARALIDALAAAGAPFEREGAPRHAASPALAPDLGVRRR